ncbi:hypothetical protein os1_18980 [Comamonadaceae bacterium OS-1]|nr:hypothetical protein os1_18980 [Comamonadaceae bacterium OS-1]
MQIIHYDELISTMQHTKLHFSALAAALALCCGTASAGPMITDWSYNVSTAFDTTTAVYTAAGGCQTSTGAALTWGGCGGTTPVNTGNTATSRSGLTITQSPAIGTVQTNGLSVPTNTFTHYNNALSSSLATLQSVTVKSTLTLNSLAPATGVNYQATLPYFINFLETPNTAGTCVAASPTPCNDIFVIAGLLNNSFVLDNNTYYVSIFDSAQSLSALPTAVCNAVNASAGCMGFTTVEGQANAFSFNFLITSTPVTLNNVPEPSSLALLGLGLVAAAATRRRAVKSA